MKLDTSLAWHRAHGAVMANRDVLMVVGGVFFLLPRLVLALLGPMPDLPVTPGMAPEQAAALIQQAWLKLAPFALPVLLIEAAGTLSLVALFADRSRPTVGQAIGQGLRALLPYLLAQILFTAIASLLGVVVMGAAAASGVRLVQGIGLGLGLGGLIYGLLRMVLLVPVVVIEGRTSPAAAITRAWALTRGNASAIGLFFCLAMLVMAVAVWAAVATLGLGATLLGGAQAGQITGTVVEAVLGTVFSIYFAAVLASFHAQLAGREAAGRRTPFD